MNSWQGQLRSGAGRAGRARLLMSVFCLAIGLTWPWAEAYAGEDDGGQAYRVAVGLVVLESEAPWDDFGRSEFYVSIDRQDPVAMQEVERLDAELDAVGRELEMAGCPVMEMEASGFDALSSERKERCPGDLRSRKASLEGKAAELWKRLRGKPRK